MDFVIPDEVVAGYDYWGDFNECAAPAAAAAADEVLAALKANCVKAHTEALASIVAGRQNEKVLVGACRVTATMTNERVGATVWRAY